MSRASVAATLSLLLAASLTLNADVLTNERTRVQFAGALGKMFNLFGGQAAREGTTSIVALKGDRRARINDQTGQIIDLSEEKVYDLDMKRKTYKVTTFDELRRQMEDAARKAQAQANTQPAPAPASAQPAAPPPPQVEVDLDVKGTGQKKTINGFDTQEVVTTVTVRQKGMTLEQGGGMVLTTDSWMTPRIAAMKDIVDFDLRYAQKMQGPELAGASADQMAAAMAMYPMMKDAVGHMNVQDAKADGTPILTTMTFDSVKSADQMAQEQQNAQANDQSTPSTANGVSGLVGGFAKRMTKKKTDSSNEPQARATVMTITDEVLKVSPDVTAADVAIPPGFHQK